MLSQVYAPQADFISLYFFLNLRHLLNPHKREQAKDGEQKQVQRLRTDDEYLSTLFCIFLKSPNHISVRIFFDFLKT